MPTQVIPIEGIDKAGFIADTPAVNLPQGAWSDVQNVRFRDGAIRTIKGHRSIFFAHGLTNIQAIAYWENPNERQYVAINAEDDGHHVYTITLDSTTGEGVSQDRTPTTPFDRNGKWQIEAFNGGYSIVINNGVDAPHHITATPGIDLELTDLFEVLPGWELYLVGEDQDPATDETATYVSAGIIIPNGNLLLAGNLIEQRDPTPTEIAAGKTGRQTVRSLDGVVRSSSVAAPGTIPQNWNPFALGAGTADELIIADTGTIRAMKNLRGSTFIYTSDTIHQLRVVNDGLSSTQISNQYGALSQNGVFEFQGAHMVVGSDDIYVFSGNPGDIKSVADGRVRRYFYDNLSAEFFEDVFIQRDQAFDELWICYPTLNSNDGSFDEALIWNYHHNTFTKRDLPHVRSLTVGPIEGGSISEFLYTFTGTAGSGIVGIAPRYTLTIPSNIAVVDPDLTTSNGSTIAITLPDEVSVTRTIATSAGNTGTLDATAVASAIELQFASAFTNWVAAASGETVAFTRNTVGVESRASTAEYVDDGAVGNANIPTGQVVLTQDISNPSNRDSGRETTTFPTIQFPISDFVNQVIFRIDPANPATPTTTGTGEYVVPSSSLYDLSVVIQTYVNTFSQFTADVNNIPDATNAGVEIQTNQYGNNPTLRLPTDNIIVNPGTLTDTAIRIVDGVTYLIGQAFPATIDFSYLDASLYDEERPWPVTELNEARNFLVSAGRSEIYAMDVSNLFDDDHITAFVERRNFQLEPLQDTETLTGFYMNTDTTASTNNLALDIKLQGVETSSDSINLPVEGDTHFYKFSVGGDDADYKVDTRINSRLLNVQIGTTSAFPWEIQNMGVSVGKGGTR